MKVLEEDMFQVLIMSFELGSLRSDEQQPQGILEKIRNVTNQSGTTKMIRVNTYHPLLASLIGLTKKLIMIEPSNQPQQMLTKHLTLNDFQHPFPWKYQSFYQDTPLGLLALTYDSLGYVPDTYWIQS